MYEWIQVGPSSYYIDCPAKMGVYCEDGEHAYLIDSGNDKDAGKKALKLLEGKGWTLKAVINTHSHADHAGGNYLLQQRTGCSIYSSGMENAFIRYPVLEPSFLYGGYPFQELRGKFLMSQPSLPSGTVSEFEGPDFRFLPLAGHYFEMVGVGTPDGVWYLGDSLFGEETIQKYHLFFLYDVGGYLATLEQLEKLEGKFFVPSHAPAGPEIGSLIRLNREKIQEICQEILHCCKEPMGPEEILRHLFMHYELKMDFSQYVLVGSTVRSYLSYLHDQKQLEGYFEDNRLLWHTVG